MAQSSIKINSIIRDAYRDHCLKKDIPQSQAIERLMIMDLFKNGYEVRELIRINKRIKNKGGNNGVRPV